jgi:hypothetical protein
MLGVRGPVPVVSTATSHVTAFRDNLPEDLLESIRTLDLRPR